MLIKEKRLQQVYKPLQPFVISRNESDYLPSSGFAFISLRGIAYK